MTTPDRVPRGGCHLDVWVDLEDAGKPRLTALAGLLGLHPLGVEDILETRPLRLWIDHADG